MLYFKDNPPFTQTYVNTFSDIPSFHGCSQYVLLPHAVVFCILDKQ